MGSDHYLHYERGIKKALREDPKAKMKMIERADDLDQYNKSLKEIEIANRDNLWCGWDRSYVEMYELFQKHKDDELICIQIAYYKKHWILSNLIKNIVEKYTGKEFLYTDYMDVEFTREMLEEMYQLHIDHFEGKSTMKDFCDCWHEDKEWKLEYSRNDLKKILEDKTINWEDDRITYYES